MAALVDTNVLVYSFDPHNVRKQTIAQELLLAGAADDSIQLAHQAVLEFYGVATRRVRPLLEPDEARRQAEQFLSDFEILYPNELVLRTALRGQRAYQLPWYDAHMWAYAEVFGLSEPISEDFQHDRVYGSVRIVNPFL